MLPTRASNSIAAASSRWLQYGVLIVVPLLCAVASAALTRFSAPYASYWQDALQLAHTGRIAQHFTPAGYPEFLSLGILADGARPQLGVEALQSLLHLAIALLLYALLRALCVGPRAALATALLLQLDPELLLSVTKVWDVSYSAAALLLLALLLLRTLRLPTGATALLLGLAFGLAVFERPNLASLLPCFIAVLWVPLRRQLAAFFRRLLLSLTAAAAVYAALSFVAFGTLQTPANGPYNLFAGQNPHTEASLRDDLNAEYSIVPALLDAGMTGAAADPYSLALRPFYTTQSIAFARSNPAFEVRLIFDKLLCFLRPDTKIHPARSAMGLVKIFLALAIPAWLLTLLLRRCRGMTAADWLVIAIAALYLLPFLITNSDPRFRTPLDLLLMVHTAALWLPQKTSGGTPAA